MSNEIQLLFFMFLFKAEIAWFLMALHLAIYDLREGNDDKE
jgi:hypothetical protein